MTKPQIKPEKNSQTRQLLGEQVKSVNARPGSSGCSARKDPGDSSSSSPPDDEDDPDRIKSKIQVRVLPPVRIAFLPTFPVRPAYTGEPTELEKLEGERRLKLVIEILAEEALRRLQGEVK